MPKTTTIDKIIHNHTSAFVSVSMEAEPNSVLQTSPERFEEVENKFISRYPIAASLLRS